MSDKKKQAEYVKIRYDWYKSHGICVKCGREEAQKGRVHCLECRMHINETNKKYREEHKEFYNAQHRELYRMQRERREAAGLCTKCGKRKPAEERKRCPYCLAKEKRRMEKRRREKGILPRHQYPELSLCMRCCKKEILPGKKHCQQCYEKLLRSGAKGREKQKSVKKIRKMQDAVSQIDACEPDKKHTNFLMKWQSTDDKNQSYDFWANGNSPTNDMLRELYQTEIENLAAPLPDMAEKIYDLTHAE